MKPRVGVLLIAACLLGPVGEAGPAKDDEPNEREILRLCRQGSYPEAIELAESALHRAELEFGPADTAVAKSAATLARIYHWQGRHEEADAHPFELMAVRRNLASILEMMGRDRPGTSGPESVGTTPDGE